MARTAEDVGFERRLASYICCLLRTILPEESAPKTPKVAAMFPLAFPSSFAGF